MRIALIEWIVLFLEKRNLFMPAEASYGFASFVIHVDLNSLSLGKRRAKKKSEAVHRLWELADSKEAIIFLSDCLFVYLSGEERM